MENSESVQQEITQLEQQLAEKRASLEQRSAETQTEVPHDKEILRQVVGEKIQQHAPAYQPPPTGGPQKQQDDDQSSYNDPQLVDKVQELVNIVFSSDLDNAIKSAVRSGNPAFIYSFHDAIVDQLYDTLIERKKLEKVK